MHIHSYVLHSGDPERNTQLDWLCTNIPQIRRIEQRVRVETVLYYTRVDNSDSLARADRATFDVVGWWKEANNTGDLPHLRKALCIMMLYHPTSAAAERVFSLLNNYLGDQQLQASDELMKAQVCTLVWKRAVSFYFNIPLCNPKTLNICELAVLLYQRSHVSDALLVTHCSVI